MIGIVGAVVIILGGFLVWQKVNAPVVETSPTSAFTSSPVSQVSPSFSPLSSVDEGLIYTVVYTDQGYAPQELTVIAGDRVIFKNQSSRPMWPASAMHPTHEGYPGSSIEKCHTVQQSMTFDACEGIAGGGEWSFVFNEIGEWRYHDHLLPSKTGKITVQAYEK